MHFNHELKSMADRMFSNELLDTILSSYKQEMDDAGYAISEREYHEGIEALSSILNEGQKSSLAEMEKLCAENVKYALNFGFTRGVFVGFQQFFVEETTDTPLEDFVNSELLVEPRMKKYHVYYERRSKFNQINDVLTTQLNETLIDHLISIYLAWDDRLQGVLRYAFYLGYRYALSVLNQIDPLSVIPKMLGKILLTEHETGFIRTKEEQERFI